MFHLPAGQLVEGCRIRAAAAHIFKSLGVGFFVGNIFDRRRTAAAGNDPLGQFADGNKFLTADVVDVADRFFVADQEQ